MTVETDRQPRHRQGRGVRARTPVQDRPAGLGRRQPQREDLLPDGARQRRVRRLRAPPRARRLPHPLPHRRAGGPVDHTEHRARLPHPANGRQGARRSPCISTATSSTPRTRSTTSPPTRRNDGEFEPSGMLVWNLVWDDVERFHKAVLADPPRMPGDKTLLKGAGEDQGAGGAADQQAGLRRRGTQSEPDGTPARLPGPPVRRRVATAGPVRGGRSGRRRHRGDPPVQRPMRSPTSLRDGGRRCPTGARA